MAYDVFISYSRRDMSVIDKFVKGLTDAGYTVWIDRTGVSGGEEFRRKIVQGIKQSSVVLFFSSVNSNASEWTVKEIVYAVNKKKVIIPVRLDNTEYDEIIDFDICGLSYVECDPSQPLSCLDLLVTYIANHIGRRQATATPAAASKTDQTTNGSRTPEELYLLGNSCYVKKDYEQAVKYFRLAAEQEYVFAQYMLGLCYYYGRGVARDYSEAVKWYRKAAEQGDADAQTNLGNRYYNGQGVAQDYNEALKWYRKSAEQGNAIAQYMLGLCYHNGKGVTQDYVEAVKWYRKAAEQGDADAQNNLGNRYCNGEGVAQDYAEAVKWYRKAAEQGDANGQNGLGNCYYYGRGVAQDYGEAVKWYRKAAEQGDAGAQFDLGFCYEKGKGVAKDIDEAAKWYRKAAEQGNADAIKALKRLGK